jgi:hypothetical protein
VKYVIAFILLVSHDALFSQTLNDKVATSPGAEKLQITKITTPINFDGIVDSLEWSNVNILPLISHWPSFATQPNSRTLLRVAYDSKFLYFSAFCFDDPKKIQGPYFERDKWEMTMDQITIMLDTYNDNENGVVFVVTPTGSRIDVSMKNDAQGDTPNDQSWNSFWEAKVASHNNGWSVEARVPFSSLRFQKVDGIVTMGLIAYRYIARERQMDIFPAIPPEWGFWSFLKSSKAMDVTFEGIENERPWFTSPYILGGTGHHHTEDVEGFSKQYDNRLTGGLDVQHALTDNLNMDLTVNTDFAQVEADDQMVNLSRFSLFFPEKRRFFLERSSVMEFGFENDNRLFYSRRIGINNGRIVPLWGGGRVVGRVNNFDVGVMNLQSRAEDDVESENFGVLRMRRRVSKNNSYVGGILTSRSDFNGQNNFVYGVDGIINLFKNDYLKVNLAQSYQSNDSLSSSGTFDDRKRIYVMWENRSQVGFNYALSYSQVDENYQPGLGFEARTNFKSFGDRLSYGWFPKNRKSLRYIKLQVNGAVFYPSKSNSIESYRIAPTFLMEWNKNNNLQIIYSRVFDSPPEAFDLSDDVQIAAGDYINDDITISYETPTVSFLTSAFSITKGTFYEGERLSIAVTPTYIISKYLTLSGFYQFNEIKFDGPSDYVAHVARLKVTSSLNVKLSVNAFVQLNSLSSLTAVNFRLRYNTRDGNDFYLVYNENMNVNRPEITELPLSEQRAIILKYIYTFKL